MTNSSTPVRILTVCTGNICRSPYAEHLLQDGLDALAPGEFEVGSAGTMGLRFKPLEPPLDEFLAARGIDSSDFESRRVTPALLDMADLVITLTAEHRDEILKLHPVSLRRTFTLLELAAVLEALPAEDISRLGRLTVKDRWRELSRTAASKRSSVASGLSTLDVDDPFRQDRDTFSRVASEIEAAAASIVRFEEKARAAGASR